MDYCIQYYTWTFIFYIYLIYLGMSCKNSLMVAIFKIVYILQRVFYAFYEFALTYLCIIHPYLKVDYLS